MTDQRMTTPTWGLLFLLGLIWGASFLTVRIALDEVPFVTSVAHRVVWASLALWLVVAYRRKTVPLDARVWRTFLVMGLLNNVIPFLLLAWGQLHIETGLTAILNASSAIWGVLVAAAVFPDERLSLRRVIGLAAGFLGVATATGLSNLASFDLRSLAQVAVIGATISYAAAASWARAQLKGVDPVMSATGMLSVSAAIMVPVAFLVDGPPSLDLMPVTWGAIGYFAVVSTALAYLIYYRILQLTGAGNLLLVTLLVAPVAIALGAVIRNEALGAHAYLGFGLLAIGLLILDGRIGHAVQKTLRRD